MEHQQGHCPFCGQATLEYSKEYFHNDTVVFPWKCDCGASGREVYYLDFMYHENLKKEEMKMPKYTLYSWRSDDEGGLSICKREDFTPNRGYNPESGWRARPSVKIGDFDTAEELSKLAEIDFREAFEWLEEVEKREAYNND